MNENNIQALIALIPKAIDLQNDLLEIDSRMVQLLEKPEDENYSIVSSWMINYGLFQGLNKEKRIEVIASYLDFRNKNTDDISDINNEKFYVLLESLYRIKPRKWVSAASKLLWCAFPNDYIIYDQFVKNAIVILEALEEDVYMNKRLGSLSNIPGVQDQVNYYLLYSQKVRVIHNQLMPYYDNKINGHNELRITDKILWMIGNSGFELRD